MNWKFKVHFWKETNTSKNVAVPKIMCPTPFISLFWQISNQVDWDEYFSQMNIAQGMDAFDWLSYVKDKRNIITFREFLAQVFLSCHCWFVSKTISNDLMPSNYYMYTDNTIQMMDPWRSKNTTILNIRAKGICSIIHCSQNWMNSLVSENQKRWFLKSKILKICYDFYEWE